ncbi:MAG: anthranilate synthase component II, partial [Acidobacteriota bacterium]|nr:anthranilate synthase component II [Acidobacteriota bacterium]
SAIEPADTILHGRSSEVVNNGDPRFEGITTPFVVGRYHSLAGHTVPRELETLATTGSIVMAVRHRSLNMVGLQFQPESVLTPQGGPRNENVLHAAVEERP